MSNQKGFSKIAIIIIVLILIGGAYFVFSKKDKNIPAQNNENRDSQSKQSSDGYLSKDFGDAGIIVISPKTNQVVSSPLKITGYIDDFGDGWEADFGSIELVDGNEKRINIAQLGVDATDDQGNYKKRPYYFKSTLSFNKPQTESGFLIFYEHTARGDATEKFRLSVKFDKTGDKNSKINPKDYSLIEYPLFSDENQFAKSCPNSAFGPGSAYLNTTWGELKNMRMVKGNETIIPSLLDLILSLSGEDKNSYCKKFFEFGDIIVPENGKYLYLKVFEASVDNSDKSYLIRLDTQNLSVKKLTSIEEFSSINKLYKIGSHGHGGAAGDTGVIGYKLLSDGKRLIQWDEGGIYFTNLETDSETTLHTTEQNQWLVSNATSTTSESGGDIYLTYDVKVNDSNMIIGIHDRTIREDEIKTSLGNDTYGTEQYQYTWKSKLINRITIPIPDGQ